MIFNNQKVSVVMTCYNRPNFLDKSIKSILNQTYTNFELIIVDDCSDNETNQLLKNFESKDKRIKLHFNKSNRGPTYTFNKGLYLASTNFIARMDSDDISHPQRLQTQVEFLMKNSNVFVVGTGVNFINEQDEIIRSLCFKRTKRNFKCIKVYYTFDKFFIHGQYE